MKLSDKIRIDSRPLSSRVRSAIVDRFVAGDPIYLLLWDYHILPSQLEECLREALTAKRAGKRGRK